MPIIGVTQDVNTDISLFNFYAKEKFFDKKSNNKRLMLTGWNRTCQFAVN
jgi:hypothetical protein